MKTMKQMLAGLLVVAMIITGLMITPMDANAAEETMVDGDNGEIYVLDEVNYNFETLWANRTAPTREGCVFGGWYTNSQEDGNGTFTAIKESDGSSLEEGTQVWAKFVPAEVLSVRAQLEAETEANDGANVGAADDTTITKKTTYLRLLSGVNGLDYQKVGFDIKYNKKHQETSADATNITKVYKTITNSETDDAATTDTVESIAASEVFGSAATHFSVLRLAEIYKANFEYVIYVTPQWTTLDGTLVEGQAKYVRVIDGYTSHQYISVPVNFLEGSAVSAGQLELAYPYAELEVVGYDTGVLMPEMAFYDDQAGTVKIVGNMESEPLEGTNGVEPEKDIYANVWFKVKTDVAEENLPDFWNFTMDGMSFCNWDEDMIEDITAWDVEYLK